MLEGGRKLDLSKKLSTRETIGLLTVVAGLLAFFVYREYGVELWLAAGILLMVAGFLLARGRAGKTVLDEVHTEGSRPEGESAAVRKDTSRAGAGRARWLAGGLGAGLIGALGWVSITYYSGYQVRLLSVGIGALAGLGVRLLARDTKGRAPAAVALVAGLLSMCAGKAGHLYASWPGRDLEEGALVRLSAMVAEEYERAGKPVNVKRGVGWEFEYPKEIRAEAARRWNALQPEAQAWYLKDAGHVWLLDKDMVIAALALRVAAEYESKGSTLVWPPDANRAIPEGQDDFPPKIWAEAVARFEAFTADERRAFETETALYFYLLCLVGHLGSVLSLSDFLLLAMAGTTAWFVGKGRANPRRRPTGEGGERRGVLVEAERSSPPEVKGRQGPPPLPPRQ